MNIREIVVQQVQGTFAPEIAANRIDEVPCTCNLRIADRGLAL
jgi:hypothetical protein